MSTAYFQRNEPMVQRGTQKKCQICSKQFSFRRRQHQCKRCLRPVCSQCSGDKIMCYKLGFIKSPHRGCKICCEQVKQITEYIESNQLQFGRMSNIGMKWMSRIQKKPLSASLDNRKYKKFTREVFDKMWDSYNYSLREFIGILTFGFDQGEIFKVVSEVFASVISMVPEEDIESIAYLVIFLLCFCSPDKVPFICLNLIEQKATLANQQGYISAILRALGLNQSFQQKFKQYIRIKGKRYTSSFSVNSVNAKQSIQIIQKVLTKKKIEEVYICFCLSLQLMKDKLLDVKDPYLYDLMVVRYCTFQVINNKYKQANNVKIFEYLHKKRQIQPQEPNRSLSINRQIENSIDKVSLATFTQGIKGNRQNIKPFLYSDDSAQKRPQELVFRKRQIKQQSFIEDSFSVISMIDEMNQQPKPKHQKDFQTEANELLNFMLEAQSDSLQQNSSPRLKKNSISINQALPTNEAIVKEFSKAQCQKCKNLNTTIVALTKQLQQTKMQRNRLQQDYIKQNKLLLDKVKNSNIATKTNQNFALQKLEYESQIRKLKATIQEHQQREKQYLSEQSKNQQYRRTIKKQEIDLKTYQQQLQQANLNVKMLKNKLQSQSLFSPQHRAQSQNTDSMRINEILKQNLRDKNQQIEQYSKRNKLILYQLEQLNRQRANDKQKTELRQKLGKAQKQKVDIIAKMQQLSNLLMEEQAQKLSLSQQNFQLKEMLREKGIKFNYF